MKINNQFSLPRMSDWLVISVGMLLAIYFTAPQQLGVSLYKLSLITTAAWVGYWIDRSAFPCMRPNDLALTDAVERAAAMLRRAIIIGAAMLAASLGA